MQREFYEKLSKPFRESEQKKRWLLRANKVLTGLVYLIYPAMLLYLAMMRDSRFLRVLLIPAAGFVLLSLFRKICNAKRPYEVWEIIPLIPKDTKGNSFPSRHVFSTYLIAMAAWYLWPPLGMLLCAMGIFLAAVRVIGQVHFVRDVAAGAAIGIAWGLLLFL